MVNDKCLIFYIYLKFDIILMKNLHHLIIGLLTFVVFVGSSACSTQKEEKDRIDQAENIIEQQPDSALKTLNAILFPENLNKDRFNKYHLLLLQAKDKCDKDITSDTIIFAVKDYYLQKKDYLHAALAAFYCGRVRDEQKNMEEAVGAYFEAEDLADKTEDYNLKALIQGNLGILHSEYSSYEKAIEYNQKAVELYEKAKNDRNKISALITIGNCFLLSEKIDSAFYYYKESRQLADSCKIPELQSGVRESMGVAYNEQGSYGQAKGLFNEALALIEDSVEQARILLNIAQVYALEDKADSVNYYLDKALSLQISNPELMVSFYHLKYKIAEKNKRFREAVEDYDEYFHYTMKVFDSEKNNKILELQEKYDFEKLKQSKIDLILQQEKKETMLLGALLIVVILIFVFYWKLLQNKNLLMETENKILNLQKLAIEHSKEKQSYQDNLFQYYNILKSTALFESEISEDERKNGQKLIKKFKKIVYGQDDLDWDGLYLIMNSLQNGFYDEIKEKYPQWNETEFRVFCLTYENQFNDNEIAFILSKTVYTIRKIRSKIRRDTGSPKYSRNLLSIFRKK